MAAPGLAAPGMVAPGLAALAWGTYLACSWTWCVGLFLPVVLVADAGPGAWTIFVACNIGGVAAAPFVLGSRAGSVAFLRRNLVACRVFSMTTILCQAWFAGWAASRLPGPVAAAALAGVAALLALGRSGLAWLAASAVVMLATLAAFAAYLHASPAAQLGRVLADELAWHPAALYSLPLVLAGFAFSPYLDLTFHHALRASPAPRAAFALVFPVLFGAMLLFSLAYRDELAGFMLHPAGAPPAWLVAVLAVIVLQVGFTLVLHARHLPRRPGWRAGVWGGALAAAGVAWGLGDTVVLAGRTLNAVAYRSSIGFYGVLVPCWVWAAAFVPHRPGRGAIALTAAALAVAAVPMLLVPGWLALYPCAFALMALTRLAPPRSGAPG